MMCEIVVCLLERNVCAARTLRPRVSPPFEHTAQN